jgi:hypothetical protein
MSHRFPRAPFSLTHDLPGSLVLSLQLKNRYPRGFSAYPAASQPAVFTLSGYPVYLAHSQSARFSLGHFPLRPPRDMQTEDSIAHQRNQSLSS